MAAAPNELDRLMGERIRHTQDYQTVLANRDDEIARLRRALGPASQRWKILTAARDRANYEYEAIAGQIGRPVSRLPMPMSAFLAFAVAVAMGEAFANKFLFDVALQTSNLLSLLVSFIVALFMFVAAHFAGVLLRQSWSEHKRKFYPAHVLIASTIFAVLICVLAILTVGRAETSAATPGNGFDELFSSLGEKVGSGGELLTVLAAALADRNALLLATVNALGILAAFVLGYLKHDPDKHYDKAYERHQSTLCAIEKQDQRYKRKSNRTRERARAKLNDINDRYTDANAAIVTQKTSRRIPLDASDKLALPELDGMLQRLRDDDDSSAETADAEQDDLQRDTRGPDVDSLIDAGANVTRVVVRDQK